MCLFQSMGVEQDEDEDRIRMKVEMRTRIRMMMMMMTMVENASTFSFFKKKCESKRRPHTRIGGSKMALQQKGSWDLMDVITLLLAEKTTMWRYELVYKQIHYIDLAIHHTL